MWLDLLVCQGVWQNLEDSITMRQATVRQATASDVFGQDSRAHGATPVFCARVRAKSNGASDQRVAESARDLQVHEAELVRNDVFSQDLRAGGAMRVYSAQVRARPDGASDQRVVESVQDYI